jgi:hypothetical protein
VSEPNKGNVVVFAVTALIAAGVASRITDMVWTATTGKSSPESVDDPDEELKHAVAFAVLSGATAGLIRMLINRQTRKVLGA